MAGRPLRVLVVGQTPPPFGGQAVMIQAMLEGQYRDVELHHVRMAFSEDMESVGRFRLRKVLVLFTTVLAVWRARVRHRTPVLYYPPAGPNKVPVLRDLVLLVAVRWLFRRTVFHFHASGVSGFGPQLPAVLRPLFRLAYGRPDLAIRTAEQNPDDGAALGARRSIVVPNGVPDGRGTVPERTAGPEGPLVVLFTGVLIPGKGVMVLLEAFQRLCAQGVNARLELMGKWGDTEFRTACEGFVSRHGLQERVSFLGVKRDAEKLAHFAGCDIFCFPSHFDAESFGLVLVEAMQFAKPVVSTRWRGIPSVVEEGVNGFLVPVEDPGAVADRLARLAADPALRRRMGEAGRRIFEQRFTLERFHRRMEEAFLGLRP
ncbi:MAG: glycosyltransferase [Flavobacteriales bacterium]|nr:D-inositol-3-phosphate glycosyltransferase [Flavobacteriales bacterium]MCC6576798.1 glycosyltransferase [Flavobacteriales bacterium]NUQ16015.1 glycosyltransferase [Flavobacteriales bacterium]